MNIYLVVFFFFFSVAIDPCDSPPTTDQLVEQQQSKVDELVADGSASAVEALMDLSRSGVQEDFSEASRGIVKIAMAKLLKGESDLAHGLASNVWLSSAPHDARVAAWKVIHLAEASPRLAPKGSVVKIVAPGGRDHKRFSAWFHKEFVEPHPWVKGYQIMYQLTLIEEGRAGEDALIEVVLEDEGRKEGFLKLLRNSKSTYATSEWRVINESAIHKD